MTPLGRLGEAAEVSKSVLFLAAADGNYVAGVELFVDGGLMAVWCFSQPSCSNERARRRPLVTPQRS